MAYTVGWRGYDPRSMLILPTETIVNIAATSSITLLVTSCGKLFIGCYNGIDKGTLKEIEINSCCIAKVALYREEIVLVTTHGEVLHYCSETEKKKQWDVLEPKKTCSHGKEEMGKKVKVYCASAGSDHIVFLSYRSEIWVQGKGAALGLVTNKTENEITNPARVDYFKGRKVISITAGSYFTIALVEALPPLDDSLKELNDTVSDVDSYVRFCDQCRKETGDKILFDDCEIEKCPLGLGVLKDCTQKGGYLSPTASSTGIDGKSLPNSICLEEFDSNSQSHLNSENQSNASCEDFFESKVEIEMQNLNIKEENTKASASIFSAGNARQFLSRPLLWVTSSSIDSDQLSFVTDKFNYKYPIDSATEIIRENVANAANLVSSGVKSVGDKVGQISRHFSSGDSVDAEIETLIGYQYSNSPINALNLGTPVKKSESFNVNSLPRSSSSDLKYIKCHARSESSDFSKIVPDFLLTTKSSAEMEKMKESLIEMGKNILNTEVYAWGSSNMGQLGLGDFSHRSTPTNIDSLNHFGVKKIVTGCHHTACLTVDGQVYVWGKNFESETKNKCNIPKHLELPDLALTRDIGCGDNFLVVITIEGLVYYIGDDGSGNCVQKRLLISSDEMKYNSVLCCSQSIICSTQNINNNITNFLKSEANYLTWLSKIAQKIIFPILGGRTNTNNKQSNGNQLSCNAHSKIQETRNNLFGCFLSLTYLTTKAVDSLWNNNDSDFTIALPIISLIEEYCSVYKEYFILFSNTIAVNGFNIDFNFEKIENEFESIIGSMPSKISVDVIPKILSLPFERVEQYEAFLREIMQDTEFCSQVILEKIKTGHLQWKKMITFGYSCKTDAENTAAFWISNSQKVLESLISPSRRVILHSRDVPLNFHKAGSFFTHFFILLSDVFIHNSYKYLSTYNLNTMWIDSIISTNQNQHLFQITIPEETFTLSCPTAGEKIKWIHAIQEAIKKAACIPGDNRYMIPLAPPLIRSAKYVFQKNQPYKDATYSGQWFCGKMDGEGSIMWPDGKRYIGQFRQNVFQGFGRLEEVSPEGITVYEGIWKNGKLEGRGIIRYANGDLYIGFVQKSKPHGHGELKKGRFSSEAASIYTGEWSQGVKQGYGVLDQITKGEKYHGTWQNNNRHGLGMVVTMNDVYYEGNFTQNKLTGQGLVILEDGTYYEGEVGPSGSCNGKGILRYPCGDYMEGVFSGTWSDGIKINGLLHKAGSDGAILTEDQPKSFGKTSVHADKKWSLIFKHCEDQLGIEDLNVVDTSKVWQNLASFIEQERQCVLRAKGTLDSLEGLDKILSTDHEMNLSYLCEIRDYLDKAFCSLLHPLGQLLQALVAAFRSTYGGVVSHPRLLHYAVQEVESFTTRLYRIVRYLFPTLPLEKTSFILEEDDGIVDDTIVTAASIIHPYILPPIYASISPLYVKQHQKNDEEYWQRLMKWNRQSDISLMNFLGVDIKLWLIDGENIVTSSQELSDVKDSHFLESIEALQLLSTSFSPREKLFLIHNCGVKISQEVANKVGPHFELSMDHLLPIFLYVVVRSRIQHLGAEIGLVKDLMDPDSQNGKLEHMFTTLEACYNYILFENPMSYR